MFFFTGFGLLVPIIFYLGILSSQMIHDHIFGDGHYTDNLMPKVYGSLFGALIIWMLGSYLHKRSKEKDAEDDNPLSPHSFFFIPMRFWGHIITGICIIVVVTSMLN